MSLHDVFRQNLTEPSCICGPGHVVNLRLQDIIDKQGRASGTLKFKVLFAFGINTVMISRIPWDTQAMQDEIKPESGPKQSPLTPVGLQLANSFGIMRTLGSMFWANPAAVPGPIIPVEKMQVPMIHLPVPIADSPS